ncbi:hypothetical protein EOL99_03270 [Candidatus Falkowbacteria bacterium]|nr:hypothetical protein [Candidatus Falkowbacteria bacterium]
MGTLADIKRELQVGKKVDITFHFMGRERKTEIGKVQTNCFYVLNEKGDNSCVYYPKSNLIEVEGNTFTIYEQGFLYPSDDDSKLIEEVKKHRQTDGWIDFWNSQTQEAKDKYHSLCIEFCTTDNERKQAKRSDTVRGQKLYTFEIVE